MTAYLRGFVDVGVKNTSLLGAPGRYRAFRCGVRAGHVFEKRDPLRDPRLLCGGLRRRPLDAVNLRVIVRVDFGRGFATLAYSAAVCARGL